MIGLLYRGEPDLEVDNRVFKVASTGDLGSKGVVRSSNCMEAPWLQLSGVLACIHAAMLFDDG